jgi:hypothetical protein
MTRRYAVAVEGMTKQQEEEFIAYLREERMPWWHWIENVWLLVDRRDTITASAIRDKLRDIAHPHRCLVMQVEPKSWSGVRDDEKMFNWLKLVWKND